MADSEVILEQPTGELRLGRVGNARRCPLELVDDLARLQVAVRHLGWSIRLRDTSDDLREVLELAGLDQVLGCEPPAR